MPVYTATALPRGCRKPFNAPKLEDVRDIYASGGYIHYIEVEVFKKGDYALKLWRLKDFDSCERSGTWCIMYLLWVLKNIWLVV